MALAGGLCLLSAADVLTQHSPWAGRQAKGSSALGALIVTDGPQAVMDWQGLCPGDQAALTGAMSLLAGGPSQFVALEPGANCLDPGLQRLCSQH